MDILKGVSRSFFLSLKLLPRPMRRAASLAYMLARTSDTLADTIAAPLDLRLQSLEKFRQAIAQKTTGPRWPISILNATYDPRERRLLEHSDEILSQLQHIHQAESDLIQQVLEIIISGQMLDLQRFSNASQEAPIALQDDAMLEDYTWRVAGSVGAFWTKLGFLTLGNRFSNADESELLERGIIYGKGLQLVNILRDLPTDLATGRCYLPVTDPHDTEEILACHARWLLRAEAWVAEGENYAKTLKIRRWRAATILPAMIAQPTLERMRGASWELLQKRIKVPRRVVYQSLIRAFF
jgi:farnesyl-diphosphate farnesyltransferase